MFALLALGSDHQDAERALTHDTLDRLREAALERAQDEPSVEVGIQVSVRRARAIRLYALTRAAGPAKAASSLRPWLELMEHLSERCTISTVWPTAALIGQTE